VVARATASHAGELEEKTRRHCDHKGDRRLDLFSLAVAAVLYLERRTAMVEHIVLFRWPEEASQEAIDSAVGCRRAMSEPQ
jgi:hypothetical protein